MSTLHPLSTNGSHRGHITYAMFPRVQEYPRPTEFPLPPFSPTGTPHTPYPSQEKMMIKSEELTPPATATPKSSTGSETSTAAAPELSTVTSQPALTNLAEPHFDISTVICSIRNEAGLEHDYIRLSHFAIDPQLSDLSNPEQAACGHQFDFERLEKHIRRLCIYDQIVVQLFYVNAMDKDSRRHFRSISKGHHWAAAVEHQVYYLKNQDQTDAPQIVFYVARAGKEPNPY